MAAYWLMKTDPDDFSVDTLAAAAKRTTPWTGVRNYQARNYMRDQMKKGDHALLYHSACPEPGVVAIMLVASAPYPDATQFDRKSKYYDAKATPAEPRWWNVDVTLEKRTRLIPLEELRGRPELATLQILRRGNRLSITPVDSKEWQQLMKLV